MQDRHRSDALRCRSIASHHGELRVALDQLADGFARPGRVLDRELDIGLVGAERPVLIDQKGKKGS
jgi:hypothetical protein